MQLFKIIVNWTPKIWLPLAIVLLDRAITIVARQHLLAYLDLDLFEISPIIVGSFAIAGALINWVLLSVLLFFACRLLCDSKGVFRNFFKSIGLCHLVLLVVSLGQFTFILLSSPPDLTTLEYNNTTSLQEPAETTFETLASIELPVQGINIAGYICFGVILVGVVQTFFQIRSGQALFITCISHAIYWVLSEALLSIFLHVFLFFFGESLVPSWQPGIQISP